MSKEELDEKWRTYLFLTEEMKKFVLQKDVEMFTSLLEQRGELQKELEKISDEAYYTAEENLVFLRSINVANKEMLSSFHAVFHAMKQREKIMQSYEGGESFTGNYLNQQR